MILLFLSFHPLPSQPLLPSLLKIHFSLLHSQEKASCSFADHNFPNLLDWKQAECKLHQGGILFYGSSLFYPWCLETESIDKTYLAKKKNSQLSFVLFFGGHNNLYLLREAQEEVKLFSRLPGICYSCCLVTNSYQHFCDPYGLRQLYTRLLCVSGQQMSTAIIYIMKNKKCKKFIFQ